MRRFILTNNKKGQATTELAIMGAIVLVLLSYLVTQGAIYNQRLGLEMYTFRKALKLSQDQQRGVSLQVMRDTLVPSFFSGLNRQKIMASAVVDYNPWMLYNPDVPQDLPTRQFIQMNEEMLRNDYLLEIPPTKVKVATQELKDQDKEPEWQWVNSAILGVDDVNTGETTPANPKPADRISTYGTTVTSQETSNLPRWKCGGTLADGKPCSYIHIGKEPPKQCLICGAGKDKFIRLPPDPDAPANKATGKILGNTEKTHSNIVFEEADEIIENYKKNDWEEEILSVEVKSGTIPKDVQLEVKETLRREKGVQTRH